jgi:hypothetical protein
MTAPYCPDLRRSIDEHRGRPGRPERRLGARSPWPFSINERDAVPPAEPDTDADRKPWPEGRRRATSPSML